VNQNVPSLPNTLFVNIVLMENRCKILFVQGTAQIGTMLGSSAAIVLTIEVG
jgi:hypothetical protein